MEQHERAARGPLRARGPWLTMLTVSLVGLLVASCCVPCDPCNRRDPWQGERVVVVTPDDGPGYPMKRVRFRNSGAKPVSSGMNAHFSPSVSGSGPFVLHSDDWSEMGTGDGDERANDTTDLMHSYRFVFEVVGGPAIDAVCARPDIIGEADDVGVCEAVLESAVEDGKPGFKLRYKFTYVSPGQPGELETPWTWAVPTFFEDPTP